MSIRYFDVAALYARMTILLRKTALEMDFHDQKTRAICDAVIYCMNDLELAMASRSHQYPEFRETAYRSAQSYELNRQWFQSQHQPATIEETKVRMG